MQLEPSIKKGYRWELPYPFCSWPDEGIVLFPSWCDELAALSPILLRDEKGGLFPLLCSGAQSSLRLAEPETRPFIATGRTVEALEWIEVAPPCLGLVYRLPLDKAFVSTLEGKGGQLHLSTADELLLEAPFAPYPHFVLSCEATLFASTPDFEELLSLTQLREVELMEHQLRAAKMVLSRFRGRGLLCDEVGLGKTVEAGLIAIELFLRKLARRILILTPPSLVRQWQVEMQRKFALPFVTYDDEQFKDLGNTAWSHFDLIIASYQSAKREPHRPLIAGQHWDLVIIDEAHHARNSNTMLWKFLNELEKKYMLLLTATPMQNNLEELFNLVTLLKPGLLRTAKGFRNHFIDRKEKGEPRHLDELQKLLQECMVRNRRSTISLRFTKRHATTLQVDLSPEMARLYGEITAFIKQQIGSRSSSLVAMSLLALQKQFGSLPHLFPQQVAQLIASKKLSKEEKSFFEQCSREIEALPFECPKSEALLAMLKAMPDSKLVLFTQFRLTQERLYQFLRERHVEVILFHGSMTRMQKERAIEAFQHGPATILLTTDAGSEGRNLQFCHRICNFDLPWNPMRIEQRVGRLSRIGQTRDVEIYNLVHKGTIEESILHVLAAKINLFELVVGELDMILGNLDEEREFEELVRDLWLETEGQEQFAEQMEAFGERLLEAKESYLQQQAHDDSFFGDHFATAPQEGRR